MMILASIDLTSISTLLFLVVGFFV
ncbi:MAG: hypothetical protein K1060chlam1_00001, partial [Candidatus Anoxychlamydiales bacterium]|nr:hypothetical protein [Candidatus Anoxychlamydiales bacterium]